MDEEQRFAFDTWGFLTVEDAITPGQVAELKATVDARGPELYSQHPDRGGFWSQAFVDLLDVPVVSDILEEIFGGPAARRAPFLPHRPRQRPHPRHLQQEPRRGAPSRRQRTPAESRPAARADAHLLRPRPRDRGLFQRSRDCGLRAGGYRLQRAAASAAWAGSHKGHLPVPEEWVDLSRGVHPMVTRVPAPAGTAIIFTEALFHATLPWTAPSTRTTLFYKYTERG